MHTSIVAAVTAAIAVDSDYWKFYLEQRLSAPHYLNTTSSSLRDAMRMDYAVCSRNFDDRRYWQIVWRTA